MLKQLKSAVLFILVFLLCSEGVLRLTSYEEDSRIYLYGIFPIALAPTKEIWQQRFEELSAVEKEALHYATYDSLLGWGYRPNYLSKDSLYKFDEHGMRAHPASLPSCSGEGEGCLKILIAGNSYMMSAEVGEEMSLAYFLEQALVEKGIDAHVYNGAAGNYSIDQAYLQWKYKGREFSPDVIVLGVNPQSYSGNASFFPYSYYPETHIYYSKPRAVLQGDSLVWHNLPTVPLEHLLAEMVVSFEKGPLAELEYQQKLPRLQESEPFMKSYVLSTINRYALNMQAPKKGGKREVQQLTHRIVEQFRDEAQAEGARLILLQTPVFEDILRKATGIKLIDNPIPYAIDSLAPILYTEGLFLDDPIFIQEFTPSLSHYSSSTNEKIAKKLASFILEKAK